MIVYVLAVFLSVFAAGVVAGFIVVMVIPASRTSKARHQRRTERLREPGPGKP